MALRSYSYYEGLLSDPRVQAALNTVSWADGLMDHPLAADPYSTTFGYDTFDNSGWHPGKENRASSAVGKYQAMAYSFPDIATQLGIPNLAPVNQDVFAVALMDRAGALQAVLDGDVAKFAEKLDGVWTSLPGGPQQRVSEKQVKEAYSGYYSAAKNNPSTLGYTNPQQPTKTKDSPTMAAQKGLAGLGYVAPDDMTGAYGRTNGKGRFTYDKSLVEGIKSFQRDMGLPQTGELNQKTLETIATQSEAQAARDGRLGMLPDVMQAPGGIIDTGRTTVNGMDYTQAAAALQPGFDQYEAGRNLSRSLPDVMSAPGGLFDPERFSSEPAFDAGRFSSDPAFDAGRFATYQPPAPNSPEKAYENAVRNSYFDSLSKPAPPTPGAVPAPAPSIGGFAPQSPFGALDRVASGNFTPTSPFGGGLQPGSGLSPAPTPPSAPVAAYGTPEANRLTSAYETYGGLRAMAPTTPVAPTANAIDVPNSAMSLADQYASYGMGRMPQEVAATATQAAPATRSVAPQMEVPTTVAPRSPTQTQPAQPAMTAERAKAMGMVPTPGVPGAYMPDVKANPAQVARDQAGLIAANPFEAIGRMVAGALQGGVFFDRLMPDFMRAPGGIIDPSGGMASAGGMGGMSSGGMNGGGGAFGVGGGNFGIMGSSGSFNSGLQSGSGFTFDR